FKYIFKTKLNGDIIKRMKKGKWVNVGFIFYKLKRIFPRLIPGFIVRFFDLPLARRWALYAPTADIQYLIIRKGSATPAQEPSATRAPF
ncbi:MAG: hypothetical protein L0Y73_08480, partial [Candidatus Aminicenantes bacterium]|nr:hypothetical protein [Candidatus Aminicenantes bacterium]